MLSQLSIGKSITPDFNAEETISVEKDKREITKIIWEMAKYVPHDDLDKGILDNILTYQHME